MKNLLITGANGQLGNEMRVLSASHPEYTYYFTDIAELDVCDKEAVKQFVQEHSIDCIINCAAYTAVDKAEDEKKLCKQLNADAPRFLAEAAQSRGAAIIHISTDYVFNGEQHKPYREVDEVCPVSVYGRTKLQGEQNVLQGCYNSMVIRTAWLYSSFGKNFVKTMIRLGKEKESLGVVFDEVGTPTYARDLAAAIYQILGDEIVPGIYHYSNEGVCSWYDFTKAIHRLAGIDSCEVRPLHTDEYPTKATRPYYSVLDKTKIKETFNMEIPYWEDSLEKCVRLLEAGQ